ncbi:phosphatase PAP2 family protein [Candidatus Gracilibacteria bacterium]|nr:phosphatase PAP2 family protein [Candidatus Gracilibacteria bacterium]
MLEKLISVDVSLLNFIRSIINPDSILQVELVKFFADFGVFYVALLLVGLWLFGVYLKKDKPKEKALWLFYSIAFSFLIYVILNLGLPLRPRPETVSAIRPLVDHLPDNSFPSGHAIFAGAAILASFFFCGKKWIIMSLVVVLSLMLVSRIIAGIHYPSDIFVGLIIGFIGSFVIFKLSNKNIFTKYLIPYPIKFAKFFKL